MLLFWGCKKIDQVYHKSSCRISKIYVDTWGGGTLIGHAIYTSWGSPRAIQLEEDGTGQESLFFQYDEKRNLTGFLAGYTPSPGETDTVFMFYHKYIYKNGKIVGDSLFTSGSLKHPIVNNENYAVGKYTYDHFGRVIKYEADGPVFIEPYVENYSYPNENPYIMNTNFLGTHIILMFVARDYNRKNNNVSTTNEYGLPTEFSSPYYYLFSLPIKKIDYDCGDLKN
jgi:hypothetical protein